MYLAVPIFLELHCGKQSESLGLTSWNITEGQKNYIISRNYETNLYRRVSSSFAIVPYSHSCFHCLKISPTLVKTF